MPVLAHAQLRALCERVGACRGIRREQHLGEQVLRALQVAEHAQFTGDQHPRAVDGDAVAVADLGLAQVPESEIVSSEIRRGISGQAQRGDQAFVIARALVQRKGVLEHDERTFHIAAAQLD
jgi:hypothetical protein